MEYFKGLARLPVFPLIIGVSLVVGRLIPAFYDWTGSEQSRPSPLIFQTAVGVLLCGIMACLALPWLHIEYDPPTTNRVAKVQFTIRTLLVMTAVVAVFLVAFRKTPLLAVSGGLHGIALCYVVRFWILFHSFRWQVASLLACMYFPFAWIIPWSERSNVLPEMLWMASGLPAFFFTLLVGSLFRQYPQELSMAIDVAD